MTHPTQKTKRKRKTKPPVLTERFDVRCSPEEKQAIYNHANRISLPVTRFVTLAALREIERWESGNE